MRNNQITKNSMNVTAKSKIKNKTIMVLFIYSVMLFDLQRTGHE